MSDDTYEFAVSVHVEPDATVTDTVPFWPDVFIAPLNVELPERLIARVDTLSTRILPVIVCPDALSVTLPPFEPELPQLSDDARRKYPEESLFVIVTPESVIVQIVFVT